MPSPCTQWKILLQAKPRLIYCYALPYSVNATLNFNRNVGSSRVNISCLEAFKLEILRCGDHGTVRLFYLNSCPRFTFSINGVPFIIVINHHVDLASKTLLQSATKKFPAFKNLVTLLHCVLGSKDSALVDIRQGGFSPTVTSYLVLHFVVVR